MASIEGLAVAPIDASQSEAVWPLSIEAGWNQTLADWCFMLGAGHGFGCRSPDGRWRASSLVLPLGPRLAWISMVLVAKARRGGGIGTVLLKRCIEEVRDSGAVAGLDATELGRPIYLSLGFRDLYRIPRWHLDQVADTTAAAGAGFVLRPIVAADLPKIVLYDRPRSGMDRPAVLAHLAKRQPGLAWLAQTAAGRISGFVLGREGHVATSVGPVVADSEEIALALIARAVCSTEPPFILDVPDRHNKVRAWLEGQRAATPRAYVRMTMGEAEGLADPAHLFALAGPELG